MLNAETSAVFTYVSKEIKEITKVCDDPNSACKGRICSVLEGGYDISEKTNALAKSVVAHVETLSKVPEQPQKMTAAAIARHQ